MGKYALVLVIYVLFIVQFSKCTDFTYSAFGSNIHDISPAAFGDFNSDELTDLFVIKNNETAGTVQVFLGSTKEPYFSPDPALKCTLPKKITSVVPGDYNGDGLMDLLVTVLNDKEQNKDRQIIDIYVHWGNYNEQMGSSLICSDRVLLTTWDEPLAITHQTDLRTDLFGVDYRGISRMNKTIFRLSRDGDAQRKVIPGNIDMKYPHSHAFLDINEDNYADLVLTTQNQIQVYLYDEEVGFKMDPNFNIPYPNDLESASNKKHDLHVGQILFIDLESNDKLYAVLPMIKNNKSEDHTSIWAYSFEYKEWTELPISFVNPDTKEEWSFNYYDSDKSFFGLIGKNVPSYQYMDIPTLRAGDFDNDGFVDLLATLRCHDKIKTYLLLNKPTPFPTQKFGISRTFDIQWTQLSPNNEDAVMGVFFDFMQDGILDVIFVKHVPNEKKYVLSAYKNSLDYDANFIKVMVISGIDNPKVQMPASSILGKKHFFGSNLPGPKIHYKTTNQNGVAQYGRTSQLAQSAHFALNLPYTIFGLGRSPNFVEDLIIGMFNETKQISPIIPNSQLVIRIPNTAAKNPSKWRAQLFVTPSKIIWQTVFALTGTCIALAIVIAVLQWRERREDKMERLQESQRFHFDAM